MSTFTAIDDKAMVAAIDACSGRLAYISPGISEPVAQAIDRLLARAADASITIIIDTDAEVCRLGYGTVAGLTVLQDIASRYQISVRHQPGLRLGILAADDELLVFAPTPQLLEAAPRAESRPNAIRIGANPRVELLHAAAVEGEPEAPLPRDAQIGQAAATPKTMEHTLKDLKENPPKRFDVARVERIFSSQLLYVELEVTGYKLSAVKLNIPNDLLVGDAKELIARLRNSYSLLGKDDSFQVSIPVFVAGNPEPSLADPKATELYSQERLEDERLRIQESYLHVVPGYGWLMYRRDQGKFERDVRLLQARVEQYGKAVGEALRSTVDEAIAGLAGNLLEKLGRKLPTRLQRLLPTATPTDKEMLQILERDLKRTCGKIASSIKPVARWVYKELTYESLGEPRFRKGLDRAFGEDAFASVFEEFDAAREARSRVPS